MFRLFYFTTASGKKPVADFLDDQGRKEKEKVIEVIRYFAEYEFHLPTRYLRRMSGIKRLWELRTKYQNKQYRIFVAKLADHEAVLLHAIVKKTDRTPTTDIQVAEERLKLVEQV
jgi:phage-related protein